MEALTKEQFLHTMLRVKKSGGCFAQSNNLQSSELAVMYKASVGCAVCGNGFTVSQIQQSLHITKPAVSQILNGLEKKGYIIRSIAAGDRRKIMVTVTADGEEELRDAMRCQNEILEQVFCQFGEEDIRRLIGQVNRLLDILETIHTQGQTEKEKER